MGDSRGYWDNRELGSSWTNGHRGYKAGMYRILEKGREVVYWLYHLTRRDRDIALTRYGILYKYKWCCCLTLGSTRIYQSGFFGLPGAIQLILKYY